MSDSCSSSSFDPAPGSSLDDDLAITLSTQTLSLTGTDTSQRNDSEGSEAIAGTTADTPARIDQTINSSSQQDAVKEEPSHSERACQSNGALSAAEPTEEMYTIAETARNKSSSFGAESRATVLDPGFEGPSETTSVNLTASKDDPDHGVLPTSISTAHEEGSDDNNGLTISKTSQIHNETGQDADETAKEKTPQDDFAESSSAVQDIAQDRSRREEGSWNAKEEAIHHEVWKQFDVRMKMLRSEMEDLGARFATRLEERQREVQQNDTQDNEDEDEIITEIEEEFRQERNGLQNDIDDLNEAFTLELSEREFHELRSWEGEPDEEDPHEASTGACTLQIADASNANNDVDGGIGDAEIGSEEVDIDPEDDLEEVEVDTEDDVEAVYSDPEHSIEGKDGNGTITKEEKADDEEVEMYVTKEPPIQTLNEQSTGDTVPESSYEVSSESDPANCIGHQLVPQQAPADATNPGTFSNDNTSAHQKSQESAEHTESESSKQNNRNHRAINDDSIHDAPEAHASIGSSGQQETSIDSKEAESQEKTTIQLKATDQPGEARTTSPSGGINSSEETEGSESPAISGEVAAAGEAEVTRNTASPGGSNDSGLSRNSPTGTAPVNNDPTSTVPTSTIPTDTNTIPANNVAAEHGSQRRVRHHMRKAQPKKYGANADNGKKGGS